MKIIASTTSCLLAAALLLGCQASMSARGQGSASAQGQGNAAAGPGQPAQPPPAGPGGVASGPALGECAKVGGNGQVVQIPAGTCDGDLIVSGNSNRVTGAGPGRTVVRGALILSGNGNAVSQLTVLSPSNISGNGNSATGTEFRAAVDMSGHDNSR